MVDALENLCAQGVIFSTDHIKRSGSPGSQTSQVIAVSKLEAQEYNELLSKADINCVRRWPELLLADVQLLTCRVNSSPLHLALAIIMLFRKRVGLQPLMPMELKLMAFGDIYRDIVHANHANEKQLEQAK